MYPILFIDITGPAGGTSAVVIALTIIIIGISVSCLVLFILYVVHGVKRPNKVCDGYILYSDCSCKGQLFLKVIVPWQNCYHTHTPAESWVYYTSMQHRKGLDDNPIVWKLSDLQYKLLVISNVTCPSHRGFYTNSAFIVLATTCLLRSWSH